MDASCLQDYKEVPLYTLSTSLKVEQDSATSAKDFKGDAIVVFQFDKSSDDDTAKSCCQSGGYASVSDDEAKTLWEGGLEELSKTAPPKSHGKIGKLQHIRLSPASPVRYLIVVGAGKQEASGDENAATRTACSVVNVGKAIADFAVAQKLKNVGIVLPSCATCQVGKFPLRWLVSLLVNIPQDNRFKGKDESKDDAAKEAEIEKISLIGGKKDDALAKNAQDIAKGVLYARALVSAPPNCVTPVTLAKSAEQMAKENGLEAKILSPEECQKLGMGSYLAVGQGAVYPPRFIHLTYKPSGGKATRKICLVGKGITFDSGGLNLKVAGSQIELMKFDMGGSAAVLGAARAIGALKPTDIEVHFIVASAENAISDKAYRPGDILTASNGKTIEVINTDAEGRLTLADALVYADKLEPNAIIDLATLTGACMVALGTKYAGVFSPHEKFCSKILSAAGEAGELVWSMPVAPEYREALNSKFADLKNLGARHGGAITAALFLQEFVKKTTPWAHIDIAGPAWDWDAGKATGFGVTLLTEWLVSGAKTE